MRLSPSIYNDMRDIDDGRCLRDVLLREGRDRPSGRERHADDSPLHFQAPSARLTATI
jgi:hypothetical protein